MARLQNTFKFIGTLNLAKNPVKTFVSEKSGWTTNELQIFINESKENGTKVNIKGGYHPKKKEKNKIYSFTRTKFGEKGEMVVLDFEDRKDASIVRDIANFKKIVVDFTEYNKELAEKIKEVRDKIRSIESNEKPTKEDKMSLKKLYKELDELRPDYNEFIHMIDVVEWFEKNADKVKGKRVKVTGDIKVNYWNGKSRVEYVPTRIGLAHEEEENILYGEVDLYFTNNCDDRSNEEQEKFVRFNAYIYDYDSGHKKDVLLPFQVTLNGRSYDFENPKHKAHYNIINRFMTPEKDDVVYQLPWSIRVQAGADSKELSEDDLTEQQKEMIDAGMCTIDQFKTTVYGDKIYEVRLGLPLLRDFEENGSFINGSKETDLPLEALEYTPVVKDDKKDDKNDEDEDTNDDRVTEDPFANAKGEGAIEISEDDLPF